MLESVLLESQHVKVALTLRPQVGMAGAPDVLFAAAVEWN